MDMGRILMLEPRRLAARAAASRMASLIGEPVGRTVGFRTRLESAVSSVTRIEVVTTGLLIRRLLGDPGLDGVAAVILDEIHERSLEADLALALCLDAQAMLRRMRHPKEPSPQPARCLPMLVQWTRPAVSRRLEGG